MVRSREVKRGVRVGVCACVPQVVVAAGVVVDVVVRRVRGASAPLDAALGCVDLVT